MSNYRSYLNTYNLHSHLHILRYKAHKGLPRYTCHISSCMSNFALFLNIQATHLQNIFILQAANSPI